MAEFAGAVYGKQADGLGFLSARGGTGGSQLSGRAARSGYLRPIRCARIYWASVVTVIKAAGFRLLSTCRFNDQMPGAFVIGDDMIKQGLRKSGIIANGIAVWLPCTEVLVISALTTTPQFVV